jgi:hypothetical protein
MYEAGYQVINKTVGQPEKHYCEVCERERTFHIVLTYIHSHMWFIFGWVREKQYHLACDICSRGKKLAIEEVEKIIPENTIPFMHRHGWKFIMFPLILVFSLMVITFTIVSIKGDL